MATDWKLVVLASLAAVGCAGSDEPADAAGPPRYRPTACGAGRATTVECGFLDVPESRTERGGRRVSLYVERVLRGERTATNDQVLVLQGGPGGNTVSYEPLSAALPGDRDVVFVMQRGSGFSEPALGCGEFVDAGRQAWALASDDPERVELARSSALACRERLTARGIDLAAYDTEAAADDIEDLRIALGVGQWDLIGMSYGTRLALEVMRTHPQSVRSAVLAGTFPPQADRHAELAENAQRAIDRLLDACAADSDCPLDDPHAAFLARVDELDREPFEETSVPLTDGESVTVRFDGGYVADYLFGGLYVTDDIPGIMWILTDPDPTGGLRAVAYSLPGDSWVPRAFSDGLFLSVMCREEFEWSAFPQAPAPPRHLRFLQTSVESERARCEVWAVGTAAERVRGPVVSDVPALFVSGGLDPITPPHWATAAAQTLSQAYTLELPWAGHDAVLNACAQAMIAEFVDDPSAMPDDGCIAEQPPPDF